MMADETNDASRETLYALRRTDNELIYGEFSYLCVSGPDDWGPVDDDLDDLVTYEMIKMTVEVVRTRTLPECRERCGEPGEFWGLCEEHAREDDPETMDAVLAEREVG
jgi:hypothetical protein